MISTEEADNLTAYVKAGGTAVIGPFSALADHTSRITPGLFPTRLPELMGVGGQEWIPLSAGIVVPAQAGPSLAAVSAHSGSAASRPASATTQGGPKYAARTFVEKLEKTSPDTQVHLEFDTLNPDPHQLSGRPLVTSHPYGDGTAWYVGGLLQEETLGAVLETIALEAELALFPPGLRNGDLDIISDSHATYLLNYSLEPITLSALELATYLGTQADTLTGGEPTLTVGAQDARIIPHKRPATRSA